MLVFVGVSWDLNWFLRFIFSVLVVAIGLHILVRKTASKYFEVEANFEGDNSINSTSTMSGVMDLCAFCRKQGSKQCSRCKAVRYCSQECQLSHWRSGHKESCTVSTQSEVTKRGALIAGGKKPSIALIPSKGSGTSRPIKQAKDVLFPYDEFVKLFNWAKPGPPPCGLLNCGNSCFANVVLQCLSFTRPLVAYLLEKGHRRECGCNDWCFLCEFETHVERTRLSSQSFSPMNILSRLPNIGGTLGYGRQEDAHEFMRFSIDTMQSVCLDEFGGEKVVPPNLQETTLIQHIFGGCLQSEVICTKCDQKSSQYESMMDLTVEIHGDAASLEECLDQFTAKEWLHGENMYKCDGCKDYVKAWKRLTVKRAPNILTIAFKRFQSGRFGKLNKRVAFPETLNLSPYTSEAGDGSDIYKLYAVVVHLDMLNASFFGHYICYIKDFQGNWYRVDDWKVTRVELEEVLSQGAYMLLYSRCTPRPSNLQIQTTETSRKAEMQTVKMGVEPETSKQAECVSIVESVTCSRGEVLPSDISPELVSGHEYQPSTIIDSGAKCEHSDDVDMIDKSTNPGNEISCSPVGSSSIPISQAVEDFGDVDMSISPEETPGNTEEQHDIAISTLPGLPNDISCSPKMGDAEHIDVAKCKSLTSKDGAYYGNGYVSANKSAV
ncbi:PREDICTED: ubiquitin carboxyl-terminal hydrolase 18-like isoform X2 [Lupinus angustifolius]|uniref:ubiquitin carboxyl-terminal hydrolase 18-like isoform X2 n=1 Tax=Lupinus angustifolius TaxID=3871 RepID=UPI00092FBDB3|nr:PREDICTED: ubiquitin carboxyl-terminal hydrolase 18-like isoform X2 [Lupinus angustifolius]